MLKSYKIGIVHYRVGRTDGVSLEIAKRQKILKSLGHDVHMIAGQFSNGYDYIIPELEVDRPEIIDIKENAFSFFERQTMTPDKLMRRIDNISHTIKQSFLKYYKQNRFDLLLIHNIFSYSLHLAAAKAFAEIVDECQLPAIATNHDYYWERAEFVDAASDEIWHFLNKYVPYEHPLIKYVSINSIAQNELVRRRGIPSQVVGDVIDFDQAAWAKDNFNKSLLPDVGVKDNDLIVLQATRIVKRKGIELALKFVSELSRLRRRLDNKTLYNGKKITPDSDIVLLLAGFTELSDRPYRVKLEQLIKRLNIKAVFINDIVGAKRKHDPAKTYSLWDCYARADIVTYPSLFEGWGNQFIEAIFARKPIVIFEYPVFKSDIEAEGYSYISLGDQLSGKTTDGLVTLDSNVTQRAARQAAAVLTAPSTASKLDDNFNIGRNFHHTSALKKFLSAAIAELVKPSS